MTALAKALDPEHPRRRGFRRALFGRARRRSGSEPVPSLLAAYAEMMRSNLVETGDAEERFRQILAFAGIRQASPR